MAAETIAVLISVVSLVIAGLALGWNIYRDVVLKARLRVRFAVVDVVQPELGHLGTYLNVTGTNFGPGVLTISMVWGRSTTLLQRLTGNRKMWIVPNQSPEMPGTPLPAPIDVGRKVEAYFPYEAGCLLSQRVTAIGLTDSFGRHHRASKKDIKHAMERYTKDFGFERAG